VALVTGATGGLGLEVATALAEAGCRVMLHGLAAAATVEPLRAGLQARAGTEIRYIAADFARVTGVRATIEAAAQQLGYVDVLVNNAVTRHFAPVADFPPERWELALAVNVSAPFHAIRLALPGMRARGWGRIVNMASVYGERGTSGRVDYVTTKAAILGLTRAVAMEVASENTTCNAICPGSVLTPGTEARVEQIMLQEALPRDGAVRRFLAGKQPSGRFVAARSIAAMVLLLCSTAGADINGAALPVDGGWLAS
jgi:3-hydroxybutyrate dehydrogenase